MYFQVSLLVLRYAPAREIESAPFLLGCRSFVVAALTFTTTPPSSTSCTHGFASLYTHLLNLSSIAWWSN